MPPNLDFNRRKSSPLDNVCPPALLDVLSGLAGILDSEGKWCAISHSWDDFFGRAQRSDWLREPMLGKTLFELFSDPEQRQIFHKLLASMAEGKLEQHLQVVEFGSGAKALHLHLRLRPLWEDGTLIGYFMQGTDVTREHLNRIALLDRDRRMRELQTVIEEQKQRLEAVILRGREREERLQSLQTQMEQQATEQTQQLARRTLEHAQEVNTLHAEVERLTTESIQQINELRAECERVRGEATAKPVEVSTNGDALRVLAAELAEEYGNLLTGVLGHSTLAAAEIGEHHAAVEDVKAIERAARAAAKLTRKLSALSGVSRRGGKVDLTACAQNYLKRHDIAGELSMPEHPCEVRVDVAALEVMLDGLLELTGEGVWSIAYAGNSAELAVRANRALATDGEAWRLIQEVARAYQGEVTVNGAEARLRLPIVQEVKEDVRPKT